MDLKNLQLRVLSAVFYGILVIFCIHFHVITTALLMAFFGFLCLGEYGNALEKIQGKKTFTFVFQILFLIIISIQLYAYIFELEYDIKFMVFWTVILSIISVLLFIGKEYLKPTVNMVFGFLYISIPFLMANNIRAVSENSDLRGYPLFFLFFSIWITDTMAYFGGSLMGKRPLLPEVSPNKTWEGTVTGILFAGIFGYFFSESMTGMSPFKGLAAGILSGIFSTTGDLFQSYIKRMAGLKDSGNIMPGHGGAWDRLDSFLFVVPVGYCLYHLF
ncbi:MAG: phosphatidate cytidylyltransferase [Bacteroidia bacterium]|nr:phosphatidate cytidylyltransferase [Bacteroidia bacterium]